MEHGPAPCLQLPGDLPPVLEGIIRQLPAATTHTILPHSATTSRLLSSLGVATPTATQLVGTLLVPALQELPPPAAQQLLDYVLAQWGSLKGDADATRALGSAAFVKAGDGTTRRAAELFDPRNPLFSRVLDGQDALFPASQYSTPAWLKVRCLCLSFAGCVLQPVLPVLSCIGCVAMACHA
jgi:hypothetical protein